MHPIMSFFGGGVKTVKRLFFRDKFQFILRDSVIKSRPLELLLWRSEISQTFHTICLHLSRCYLNIGVMCSDVVSHIIIPNSL